MRGLFFPVLLDRDGLSSITVAQDPKYKDWVVVDHPEFGVGIRLPKTIISEKVLRRLEKMG
jgi:hypothetical protein